MDDNTRFTACILSIKINVIDLLTNISLGDFNR